MHRFIKEPDQLLQILGTVEPHPKGPGPVSQGQQRGGVRQKEPGHPVPLIPGNDLAGRRLHLRPGVFYRAALLGLLKQGQVVEAVPEGH